MYVIINSQVKLTDSVDGGSRVTGPAYVIDIPVGVRYHFL